MGAKDITIQQNIHFPFDLREMQSFLDEKAEKFNTTAFIDEDPVSIPHSYTKKQDIEIAAFLTATIAWGNRKAILKSAGAMLRLLDDDPHAFVMSANTKELKRLSPFVHRTFNGNDLISFVKCLRYVYKNNDSIEQLFAERMVSTSSSAEGISAFRETFFKGGIDSHARKHISDPASGSAAKRLNMFLRWMVRQDKKGVDFGIWKSIPASSLSIPLDVHSGNISRKLGLLVRKQNDLKAVTELDATLRMFDPDDPVKYDFALFGLGAIEKF